MDLAAKVAADWQKDNSEILTSLKDRGAAEKAQLNELRAKGKALSHHLTSFHVWISILEGVGLPKTDRVAREMRAVLKKTEGVLYG